MARIKICLDAGHYGDYNRSPVVPEYYESHMTWRLHQLLRGYLEQYGVEVIVTRAEQKKDLALYQRGAASKGCDLFLSLHSNAVGGKVGNEHVDRVMVYGPIDGRGKDIADKLGRCIREVMGTSQGSYVETRKGNRGDYYGVIRGATAVGTIGLLVEHSFHTCTRSARWLLDESNLDKLARAEAAVLAEYYGLSGEQEDTDAPDGSASDAPTGGEDVPFRVRVAIDDLNIRSGPGTDYDKVGRYTGRGVFTIVEVRPGKGSDAGWGKLKSGAGWIALGYAQRV